MKIRYRLLFISGMLFLSSIYGVVLAQEAATPESHSPGATVTGFYNWYLDYIMGSGTFRNPLVERAYQNSEYLTEDLIARIDERLANAGETGIGYDLFLCAQDLPARYEYEVIRVQSGEALVLLREYFGSNPRSNNLTLTLKDTEGIWKIDDVVCGDMLTPRGVTQDFYNWYLDQWHRIRETGENANMLTDGTYRDYPYFTEELLTAVDEAVANRQIGDGDPFLCAQDIPQGSWIHDISMKGNEAAVLVQTFYQGNTASPNNLTVRLVLRDDQWLIAEIICGIAPETMAQLLYGQYAAQVRYHIDNELDMNVLRDPAPHWHRNVSPELLERLLAESEGQNIADPVLCAQDIPEHFVTEVTDTTDTSATVLVSGEFPAGPDAYTIYPLVVVTMERVEGQWMLTDIRCSR